MPIQTPHDDLTRMPVKRVVLSGLDVSCFPRDWFTITGLSTMLTMPLLYFLKAYWIRLQSNLHRDKREHGRKS